MTCVYRVEYMALSRRSNHFKKQGHLPKKCGVVPTWKIRFRTTLTCARIPCVVAVLDQVQAIRDNSIEDQQYLIRVSRMNRLNPGVLWRTLSASYPVQPHHTLYVKE